MSQSLTGGEAPSYLHSGHQEGQPPVFFSGERFQFLHFTVRSGREGTVQRKEWGWGGGGWGGGPPVGSEDCLLSGGWGGGGGAGAEGQTIKCVPRGLGLALTCL